MWEPVLLKPFRSLSIVQNFYAWESTLLALSSLKSDRVQVAIIGKKSSKLEYVELW